MLGWPVVVVIVLAYGACGLQLVHVDEDIIEVADVNTSLLRCNSSSSSSSSSWVTSWFGVASEQGLHVLGLHCAQGTVAMPPAYTELAGSLKLLPRQQVFNLTSHDGYAGVQAWQHQSNLVPVHVSFAGVDPGSRSSVTWTHPALAWGMSTGINQQTLYCGGASGIVGVRMRLINITTSSAGGAQPVTIPVISELGIICGDMGIASQQPFVSSAGSSKGDSSQYMQPLPGLELPESIASAYRPLNAAGQRPDLAQAGTAHLSAVLACTPGTWVTAVWGWNSRAILSLGVTCSDGSAHGPVGWPPHNLTRLQLGVPSQFHFTCPLRPYQPSDAACGPLGRVRGGGFASVMAWDDYATDAAMSNASRSVSALRLRCAAVQGPAAWTFPCVGTGARCDPLGDLTQLPGTQHCPAGHLLAGFVVQAAVQEVQGAGKGGAAGIISQLRPLCTGSPVTPPATSSSNSSSRCHQIGSLPPGTVTATLASSNNAVIGLQEAAAAADDSAGSARHELLCPAGEWVVGWGGVSHVFIEGLTLVCSGGSVRTTLPAASIPPPAPPNPPVPPLPRAWRNSSHSTRYLDAPPRSALPFPDCASGYDAVVVEEAATWQAPPTQLSARCAGTRLFSALAAGTATYGDALPAAHHCTGGSRVAGVRAWVGTWAHPLLTSLHPTSTPIVTALQVVCGAANVPASAYPQPTPPTLQRPLQYPPRVLASLPAMGRPDDTFANEVDYSPPDMAAGVYHLMCPDGADMWDVTSEYGGVLQTITIACARALPDGSYERAEGEAVVQGANGSWVPWYPQLGMQVTGARSFMRSPQYWPGEMWVGSTAGAGIISDTFADDPLRQFPVGDPRGTVAIDTAYAASMPLLAVGQLLMRSSARCTFELQDRAPGDDMVMAYDFNAGDVAANPRFSPSNVYYWCKPRASSTLQADFGVLGVLGRRDPAWSFVHQYMWRLGTEPRKPALPNLKQGVGGACPAGMVMVGVTVVLGPSDLALPSISINRLIHHCGRVNTTTTSSGSTGSSHSPLPAPPQLAPDNSLPAAAGETGGSRKTSAIPTIIGAAVGGGLGLLLAAAGIWAWHRRRPSKHDNAHPHGKQGEAVQAAVALLAGAGAGARLPQLVGSGSHHHPSNRTPMQPPSEPCSVLSVLPKAGKLFGAEGQRVVVGEMLAAGASSWVCRGVCDEHGHVAVKLWLGYGAVTQARSGKQQQAGDQDERLLHELLVLQQLSHGNIIGLLWGYHPRVVAAAWEATTAAACDSPTALVATVTESGAQLTGDRWMDSLGPPVGAWQRATQHNAWGEGAGDAAPHSTPLAEIKPLATATAPPAALPNATATAAGPNQHGPSTAVEQDAAPQHACFPAVRRLRLPQLKKRAPRAPPALPQPAFLVLELGESSLGAVVHGPGPFPLAAALQHAQQIATALAHAHSLGWAHGDVKPGNVVLVGGVAKLADWGLAYACPPVPVPTDAAGDSPAGAGAPSAELPTCQQGQAGNARTHVPGILPPMAGGTLAYLAPERLGAGGGEGMPLEGPASMSVAGADATKPGHRSDRSLHEVLAASQDVGGSDAATSQGQLLSSGAGSSGSCGGSGHSGSAADVYAFGVMLGELVTRQEPWKGVRGERIIALVGVLCQRPWPLLAAGTDLPDGLAELVTACCAHEHESRPTAAQVAAQLRAIINVLQQQQQQCRGCVM